MTVRQTRSVRLTGSNWIREANPERNIARSQKAAPCPCPLSKCQVVPLEYSIFFMYTIFFVTSFFCHIFLVTKTFNDKENVVKTLFWYFFCFSHKFSLSQKHFLSKKFFFTIFFSHIFFCHKIFFFCKNLFCVTKIYGH